MPPPPRTLFLSLFLPRLSASPSAHFVSFISLSPTLITLRVLLRNVILSRTNYRVWRAGDTRHVRCRPNYCVIESEKEKLVNAGYRAEGEAIVNNVEDEMTKVPRFLVRALRISRAFHVRVTRTVVVVCATSELELVRIRVP